MKQALQNIEGIISKYGFFRYYVMADTTPRFSYTIGLTESIGFELIVGGMMYFETNEALEVVFNAIIEALRKDNKTKNFNLNELGTFTLAKVHNSWISKMMLGAIDYYGREDIQAFQILPTDVEITTKDIPDMTKKWSSNNLIWKYLDKNQLWKYEIPKNSTAITNLDALKGARLTEYFRYELNQWEIFAGNGAKEPQESLRIVPLCTLIGIDKSIEKFIHDPIGKGKFKDASDQHNDTWYAWE